MRWFWKRLYRERRRLLVVAGLTFLGGAIAFAEDTGSILGLPMPLVAGLAFMLGLSPCLMMVALLFPSIRTTAESVALSLPMVAFIGLFGGQSGASAFASGASIWGLILCYLTITIYGTALIDRHLPRRTFTFKSRAASRLSPATLWPHLDLTPDSDPRHIPEDLLSMNWIEPGKTFREVSRINDVAQVEGIVTIDASETPFHRISSYVIPTAQTGTSGSVGQHETQLSAHGTGAVLRRARTFDHQTLRQFLINWIDDAFGRIDDTAIHLAETKERDLAAA